jgi:putative SOS response-associated peptidase YedK
MYPRSPAFALKGRNSDPGVTNVRNVVSPHWRRWLGIAHRCVVPFTSFSENEALSDGTKPPVWFALVETVPIRLRHIPTKYRAAKHLIWREQ